MSDAISVTDLMRDLARRVLREGGTIRTSALDDCGECPKDECDRCQTCLYYADMERHGWVPKDQR